MRQLHVILHLFEVKRATVAVTNRVVNTQTPRNLREHIAIRTLVLMLMFAILLTVSHRTVFLHHHIVQIGFIVVMLVFLAEPFLERLVVKRIADTHVRSAPVRETAVVPVLLIRSNRLSKRVEFVHIRIQRRTQVNRVVHFRNLNTQVHAEQVEVHRIRQEVIATIDTEIINYRPHLIRLISRCILVVTHFHFQIVRNAEGQCSRVSVGRIAVKRTFKSVVCLMHKHRIAVLVVFLYLQARCRINHIRINRLVVTAVISPETLTEIRVIREAECWSDHMSELVHFAVREQFLTRRVEAVNLCREAQAGIKVKHIVEAVCRIFL